MPEFLWRAAHADGQAAEGRTEAAAEADVLRQLRERGLTLLFLIISLSLETSASFLHFVPH